jgi:hypothetical protein
MREQPPTALATICGAIHDVRRMNDGKHCPRCEKDIGIWPVLSATLPNRIRCPHCRARLAYENAGALMINVLLLLIVLCVASYFVERQYDRSTGVMFYVHVAALAFLAWLPIELAATFYVRSRGRLQNRDKLDGKELAKKS